MGEWIPLDEKSFLSLGLDSIALLDYSRFRLYIQLHDLAVSLDKETFNKFFSSKRALFRLVDFTPSVHARAIRSLEDYLGFLANRMSSKLKNKRLVVWFSGGKDSLATLIVLLGLRNLIDFDMRVYYIHVPLLDGERNIKFAEYVAKKLSINMEFESINNKKMYDLIKDFGLPFRGHRWCTYHAKVKLMRRIKKSLHSDYEVTSERLFESLKRYYSLKEYLRQNMFISGRQFKPAYFFTILDVVDIARNNILIHEDYLRGCSRVSCSICPYRTLYELEITRSDLEDPGFIESIINQQYAEYYMKIPYEYYLEEALWRFSPKQAELIYRLKSHLDKLEYVDYIRKEEFYDMVSRIWKTRIEAPILEFDELRELVLSYRSYGIINLGLKPNFMSYDNS